MDKVKVAFVCIHNSCRSQMAEAIARDIASEVIEPFSAGTNIGDAINPDAVATISTLYGINMNTTQHPKMISDVPPVDIVVTMGCGVSCPSLYAPRRMDWGLDDPSGKPLEEFIMCAREIEKKINDLRDEIIRNAAPIEGTTD